MVGPPGIEPRSTVPETVVLSIELQALLGRGECLKKSRDVNTAMTLCQRKTQILLGESTGKPLTSSFPSSLLDSVAEIREPIAHE